MVLVIISAFGFRKRSIQIVCIDIFNLGGTVRNGKPERDRFIGERIRCIDPQRNALAFLTEFKSLRNRQPHSEKIVLGDLFIKRETGHRAIPGSKRKKSGPVFLDREHKIHQTLVALNGIDFDIDILEIAQVEQSLLGTPDRGTVEDLAFLDSHLALDHVIFTSRVPLDLDVSNVGDLFLPIL